MSATPPCPRWNPACGLVAAKARSSRVIFLTTSCVILAIACSTVLADPAFADDDTASWKRHTIDVSSRGADGIRPLDADGDGRLDLVTGWEEGGVVRICFQPQVAETRQPWPSVTVGQVKKPEDAVFADVDGNGAIDVVSCCEGNTRTIYIHWAPVDANDYRNRQDWSTMPIGSTVGEQMWMFCLPMRRTDGKEVDLIVGSKGARASISRLSHNGQPRDSQAWQLERLCDAGWIMSLRNADLNGDGLDDVLFTDRMGTDRGIHWLERPADNSDGPWRRHTIGGTAEEVMFLDVGDLTGDGRHEVVAATKSAGVLICRLAANGRWEESMVPMPPQCGSGKGVAIADVDRNRRGDLVVSCEHSEGKHGLFWLSPETDNLTDPWTFHPISGASEGVKFDRLEMLDLDNDGDLDVITCEERHNLGVIWYENPH